MKKINKALIIFVIIFTPLLSQDYRLTMPEGFTKLRILVEDPKYLVSTSEIESFVKLKLRRNGVEYFADINSAPYQSPTLYINLNIGNSRGDLYYGNVSVNFQRNSLFHISIPDMYSDLNIIEYTQLKGRKFINGSTVKNYSGIFLKSPPATQYIKDYLDDLLDEFISEYIDANNL